jgi:hypothetical protein
MSQSFETNISYTYMHANQWEKAIQTYNFSRPFLSEKQPLLSHGLNASFSRLFRSSKKLQHGISLSYTFFESAAKNESLNNSLNLHVVQLGYILRFKNPENSSGFYAELNIAAESCGLFRYVNGLPFEYDNNTSKAFGVGGNLGLKAGYQMRLNDRIYLSPFMLAGYAPYLYAPNMEAVINQTKTLSSKNFTGVLSAQLGVAFSLCTRRNELP